MNSKLDYRRLVVLLAVAIGGLFQLSPAAAERIVDAALQRDGRLRLRIAAKADKYYVLHRRKDLNSASSKPVAMRLGEDGII